MGVSPRNIWYARGTGQYHQTGLNDIRRSAQRAADVTGQVQHVAIETSETEFSDGTRVWLHEGKLWKLEEITPDPVRTLAVGGPEHV